MKQINQATLPHSLPIKLSFSYENFLAGKTVNMSLGALDYINCSYRLFVQDANLAEKGKYQRPELG